MSEFSSSIGEPATLIPNGPGTIRFTIDDRDIVVMFPGGRVELHPDADLDEASQAFWRCVADLGWRHGIDVIFGSVDILEAPEG